MKARDITARIPFLKAYIGIEVRDSKGQIIHSREQEAHSWVRNFYNWIFTQAASAAGTIASGLGITTLGGGSQGTYEDRCCWRLSQVDVGYGYNAGPGVDTLGIVVGVGTAEESLEDYALDDKIANGEDPGQLSYTQSSSEVFTVGTTKRCQWVRYFNNNSGSPVTVNEVGIYTKIQYATAGSGWTMDIMVCRDMISPGVEVPDTGQLKVTYTIELVYPA